MNQRTTRVYLIAMAHVLADFVRNEFPNSEISLEDFKILFWKLFDRINEKKKH